MRELKIFALLSTLIVTATLAASFVIVFESAGEEIEQAKQNAKVQIAAHLHYVEVNQDIVDTLLRDYKLEDIDINGFKASSGAPMHWLVKFFPKERRQFIISENYNYTVAHLDTSEILDAPIKTFFGFSSALVVAWLTLVLVVIRIISNSKTALKEIIFGADEPKHPVLGDVSDLLLEQQQQVKDAQLLLEEEKQDIYQNSLLNPLTKLKNKLSFSDYVHERLQSKDIKNHSAIIFVRGTQLAKINETIGGKEGDHYILDLRNLIDVASTPITKRILFHFNGAEFAFYGEFKTEQRLNLFLGELSSGLQHNSSKKGYESTAVVAVTHFGNNDDYEQLMRRLYLGIASAQVTSLDSWVLQNDDQISIDDDQQWGEILQYVIKAGSISLETQAIQTSVTMSKRYSEVFSKFKDANDNFLPTQTTFLMAQRLGLAENLEKTVIHQILKSIPKSGQSDQHFGINISEDAILSKSFAIWLERELSLDSGINRKLVFEIPEPVLLAHPNACLRFANVLRRLACRVAISHFGDGFDSFALLTEMKPSYVKLNRKLIENIATDVASKHISRLVIDVAHQLNVLAIAEGVEDREQRHLLERYHIDGIQGYLVSKPKPMLG